MLTFDGHCPHCGSDKGFNTFGMSYYIIGDRDYGNFPLDEKEKRLKAAKETMDLPFDRRHDDLYMQTSFSLAGECRKCHKPIVATCSSLQKDANRIQAIINSEKETMPFPGMVESIHPQPTPPYSHPSLPDKVNETFVALQDMITEKKPAHMIITGCRAVLEASVRTLGGGKEGDTLHTRIIDLFKKGAITESLKDWAIIVKNFGNDAAHEMKGTEAEAKELVNFTKIFLQFTFEMPAIIKSLQSKGGNSPS